MPDNKMTPEQAAFLLRMLDTMTFQSMSVKKNIDETTKHLMNQFHEAIEMACTALILADGRDIEIYGGDK